MSGTGCRIQWYKILVSHHWGWGRRSSAPTREPTPVRLSGVGQYPPCALAASRRVVWASWESSKEQKGTGAATRTAQERSCSHLVPLLQPCLGVATEKPPEATVGAWMFCPSRFAVLVSTVFICKIRCCLLSRQGMPSLSLQKPGIKKQGSIQKKIHKEEKIHSQHCPVFIDTVIYVICLQEELSVSTYIYIVLYDPKHYRCFIFY